MIEKSIMLRKYVRASVRVDVWNGTGLSVADRKAVRRELVDWVIHVMEPGLVPLAKAKKGRAA